MRSLRGAALGLLGIGLILISSHSFAASWKTQGFLESLREQELHFSFIENGLNSVHSIDFGEGVVNQYRPFLNHILVSETMNDGAGRLRPLEKMAPDDVGTLAHEAFHAYKHNFMDYGPRYRSDRDFFKARASGIFADLPASKQATALEEAYATFIGWTLTNRISLKRMMERSSFGTCERRMEMYRKIWEAGWSQEVRGYYYRDSIGEYWADRAHAAWVLLWHGREAYDDLVGGDRAIFSEVGIGRLDKNWIAMRFFENRISRNFEQTFANEIASCVDGPSPDESTDANEDAQN